MDRQDADKSKQHTVSGREDESDDYSQLPSSKQRASGPTCRDPFNTTENRTDIITSIEQAELDTWWANVLMGFRASSKGGKTMGRFKPSMPGDG